MATVKKLTKSTPNPLSTPDESLVRDPFPYEYEDMRGRHWVCSWLGQGWVATPAADAVTAYGPMVPSGSTTWKVAKGEIWAAADDARGLVDGIEERIELLRVAKKNEGGEFPWWILIFALVLMDKKKR